MCETAILMRYVIRRKDIVKKRRKHRCYTYIYRERLCICNKIHKNKRDINNENIKNNNKLTKTSYVSDCSAGLFLSPASLAGGPRREEAGEPGEKAGRKGGLEPQKARPLMGPLVLQRKKLNNKLAVPIAGRLPAGARYHQSDAS